MNKLKNLQAKNDSSLLAVLAGVVALAFSSVTHAFPNNGFFLGNLANEPDTSSGFITVTYDADGVNATTGLLTATGFSSQLRANGGTIYPFDGGFGNFSLTANIDNSTGDALSGMLDIDGTIAALGFNSGDYLTGTLTNFGSETGSEALEFLFDVTGDAAALYGGSAGVILSTTGLTVPPGGNPALAFANDFSNVTAGGTPLGQANTAAPQTVPEPGTLGLMLMGGMLLYGRRRSPA